MERTQSLPHRSEFAFCAGRRRSRWVACMALTSFAAACTELSGIDSTMRHDGTIEVVETIPANGDVDVAPDGTFFYCFSKYLDPASSDHFDVTLRSGTVFFDIDLELQLFSWADIGSEQPWCPGSVLAVRPRTELTRGVLYRLRLKPDLVGWAGEPLSTDTNGWLYDWQGDLRHYVEFTIDTAVEPDIGETGNTDETTESSGPTLRDLFAQGEIFDPTRERCNCHQVEGSPATDGLDMRSPESAYADLVLTTAIHSTGYPMVSPRRPSESYLIHKLLRSDNQALHAVEGDPMPPVKALSSTELATIAAWVNADALLE